MYKDVGINVRLMWSSTEGKEFWKGFELLLQAEKQRGLQRQYRMINKKIQVIYGKTAMAGASEADLKKIISSFDSVKLA